MPRQKGGTRRPPHRTLADRILEVRVGDGQPQLLPSALPSPAEVGTLADDFLGVLFPEVARAARPGATASGLRDRLAAGLAALERDLERAVFRGLHRKFPHGKREGECHESALGITGRVLQALPELRALLLKDVQAALDGDPAAKGPDEVIACYPGLYAIAVYRAANCLLKEGAEILPRMLTEHAKSRTGIDIHPGAAIGSSFFIDHGTGIVIGETTDIGSSVRIYQGVTLGALSIKRRDGAGAAAEAPAPPGARQKRHPTIEDEVIIYANATILGGATVIGRGAVIGGNAFITFSVPPGTRVGVSP